MDPQADRSALRLSKSTGAERKRGVGSMFDRIARRYDLLNHLLSGGLDVLWRRRAVRLLRLKPGGVYLDLAAGTGDYAFAILKARPDARVLAVDLAREMLSVMDDKARRLGRESSVRLLRGDAERLPVAAGRADGVTIGYGIRNMPDKPAALAECARALKPGGRLVILELAGIPNPLLRRIFGLYFRHVLPRLGAWISGDSMAYRYLPASVEEFPSRATFLDWMRRAGFADASSRELSFGVSTLFVGTRDGA